MLKKLLNTLLIILVITLLTTPAFARRYYKILVPGRATDQNMRLNGDAPCNSSFGKGTLNDRATCTGVPTYSLEDMYIKDNEVIATSSISVQDSSNLKWAIRLRGFETGSIDSILWQASLDGGTTFIDPVNSSGTNQVGQLLASPVSDSTYVLFDGIQADHIRFLIQANGKTKVTFEFIYQVAD